MWLNRGNAGKEFFNGGHTEETRKKIGESCKGEKNSNYGKQLSDEHRKKIGEARKGKPSGNKGKQLSDEHRKKIGEAKKEGIETFFT